LAYTKHESYKVERQPRSTNRTLWDWLASSSWSADLDLAG
jgi:hypothetical protein